MSLIINPIIPVIISSLLLGVSGLVAIKQYSLSKKGIVQGEHEQKEKVVLTVIDLITRGSKYEFKDEIVEKFWKDTVTGRHLFNNDISTFIEECGKRYKIATDDQKENPNTDSLTIDSAGRWFWHQRGVAHDKFDKYFSSR